MFGTLSIQPQAPLTFVENPDLASVLSRNRRDKPHVSCELCRTRKTRCSGEPSGCDKCVAISAECRYPSRDTRRKKRALSSFGGDSRTSISSESAYANKDDSIEDSEQSTTARIDRRHHQDSLQPNCLGLPDSTSDLDMFNTDAQSNLEQQQIEQWLASDPASMNPPVADGQLALSGWPDMDAILDQPMTTAAFDAFGDDVDEQRNEHLFDEATCHSDAGDGDGDIISGQYMHPHMPLSSLVASLSDSLVSSRQQISNAASSRGSSSEMERDKRSGSENATCIPAGNRWSSAAQVNHHNRGRRAATLEERRKSQASRTSTPNRRTTGTGAGRELLTSTTSHPSQGEPCFCSSHTILLLEELGAKNSGTSLASIDISLGLLRNARVHCVAALDCERCHCQGETAALLAIACQFMSAMYENVVRKCVEMLETMIKKRTKNCHSRSGSSTTSTSWPMGTPDNGNVGNASLTQKQSSDTTDDMWFSTYRIESSCERMHVLTTLVTVHTAEFSHLLMKLRVRAGGQTGRTVILVEAEKRTNLARRMLQSSIDRAVSSKTQSI